MSSFADAARVARTAATRDYFRRSEGTDQAPSHKEWLHFAVYGHGIDLLVNFSVVDDVRPRAPRGAELARITCLVKSKDWDGDVDFWPRNEVRVAAGGVAIELGPNYVRFEDGAYRIQVKLRRRAVELDLVLVPDVFPSEANNITVEDGPPINWMVLPRLRASGTVRALGGVHTLVDCPAYHDHNWGRFLWGRNFAWEWGYALPRDSDNPYSLVFVRLTDRGHRCSLMQGIFLWKGERKERVFRDSEVTVKHEGLMRPERIFRIPGVMALLHPGKAADIPRELIVAARSGDDWVRLSFSSEDVAAVVIPNDENAGVTVIHEVSGTSRMEGVVRGVPIHGVGRSMCEFLGA